MLCGAFAFAAMGAFAHSLKEECDWQVIALARCLIPLAVAGVSALANGAKLVVWDSWSLWVRSVAGSVSLVSTFFALTRLPVSDVLTLTNLFPIWVAVLSWPLLGMVPTGDVWVAAIAGIAGVYLIQQPHLDGASAAILAEGRLATAAAVASSFCSSIAMIGLHRLSHLDIRAIVVHFSFVSLLFVVAAFIVFDHGASLDALNDGTTPLQLIGVGLSATIGQIFLTKAFTSGQPAKVSVVGLTQVGFGMLFDVVLWHRAFTAQTLLGMVLVVGPTAWMIWRRS